VLPGPEAGSPPIQQQSTAVWRKLTAISHFSKIPLLLVFFFIDLQKKTIAQFSL
jgi:hypothetical protein